MRNRITTAAIPREYFQHLETILSSIDYMTDEIPHYIAHYTSPAMVIAIEKLLQKEGFTRFDGLDTDHYTYRRFVYNRDENMLISGLCKDFYCHFAPAKDYSTKLPEGNIAICTGVMSINTGKNPTEQDCLDAIKAHRLSASK
jgi:hypothetical protein